MEIVWKNRARHLCDAAEFRNAYLGESSPYEKGLMQGKKRNKSFLLA
jgi:hypothetical protein